MTEQISDKMKAVNISDNGQQPLNENTAKRTDYLEWSEYFMAVSFLSAMRSKDPATQVHFKYKHFEMSKLNHFDWIRLGRVLSTRRRELLESVTMGCPGAARMIYYPGVKTVGKSELELV